MEIYGDWARGYGLSQHLRSDKAQMERGWCTNTPQAISGYHKDDAGHWVGELACGHFQHLRHTPPWVNRPWVMTETGRDSMLGLMLECKKCAQGAPVDIVCVNARGNF